MLCSSILQVKTTSEIDLLHQSPGLMVISNKDGDLKAWWIKNKLKLSS